MSAVTLPQGCDGLSTRRVAVLWTFHEPALCRHVHREFMRNALRAFAPIIPATGCYQSNDVETYSRFIPTMTLLEHALLAQGFMGVQKATFLRCLRPQSRDFTCANLVEALK